MTTTDQITSAFDELREQLGKPSGKIIGPRALVDIASDDKQRSDGLQFSDDIRAAHIASMDDQVGIAQSLFRFRTKQSVGVRYKPYNPRNLLHGSKIASKPADLC